MVGPGPKPGGDSPAETRVRVDGGIRSGAHCGAAARHFTTETRRARRTADKYGNGENLRRLPQRAQRAHPERCEAREGQIRSLVLPRF